MDSDECASALQACPGTEKGQRFDQPLCVGILRFKRSIAIQGCMRITELFKLLQFLKICLVDFRIAANLKRPIYFPYGNLPSGCFKVKKNDIKVVCQRI